jgi:hypothetical protein
LIADIRRLEVTGIFYQKLLQRGRRFETYAEVAVVPLEDGERFRP